MRNFLVTGGAGFIGRALVERLVDHGDNVVVIDNLSTGSLDNIPDYVEFINADCGKKKTYEDLLGYKFDAIFHLAGQSSGEISFDDPIYDIRTNAESTLHILNYSRSVGCDRILYASSVSVYGESGDQPIHEGANCLPRSFYGVGKLASENYLRIYQQFGIQSTSLRLFNVYGPGQNLSNLKQGMVSIYLAQILREKVIHIKGSKDRYRDFIYIDDVIESFIRCLDNCSSYGQSINVGTGVKTAVWEIIDRLKQLIDPDCVVQYSGATLGDVHGSYADTSLLTEKLGCWDKVNVYDGIKMMSEYYR